MLLYTFLAYQSVYELYTSILSSVIYFAICLSVLVSLDRIWHVLKCGVVVGKAKLTGREPEDSFKPGPLPDPHFETHLYPRVAVQLPMFNERAVCQAIIDSACEMHWPHRHFMVQVPSAKPQFVTLNVHHSLPTGLVFRMLQAHSIWPVLVMTHSTGSGDNASSPHCRSQHPLACKAKAEEGFMHCS